MRPEGDTVLVFLDAVPRVRAADGQISTFFCQSVDVSDRKAREARLEREAADAVWLGRIRRPSTRTCWCCSASPSSTWPRRDRSARAAAPHGDPGGELIAPGLFLPVAERYGLMTEIDCWVVRHAAERAAQGMAVGIDLSGASVGDPVVMSAMRRRSPRPGPIPRLLMFEVTETALVDRLARARVRRDARHARVQLALDDFGTGFGTFIYLKHLRSRS